MEYREEKVLYNIEVSKDVRGVRGASILLIPLAGLIIERSHIVFAFVTLEFDVERLPVEAFGD